MRSFNRSMLSVAGLAVMFSAGTALAQSPPATGLGQSWPNATDVSASPHYHVYVFERLGIRYVQVNDLNGTVRGAFGNAGGDIFGLPIGTDANRLATPSEPSATPAGTAGETVFRDGDTSLYAQPESDGTLRLLVRCDNPAKCSVQGP